MEQIRLDSNAARVNATLAPLLEVSSTLGVDPSLVQGAGGNFSVKVDETIWIKASGTRLAEALERPIYLPMDIVRGRELALETEDLSSARIVHKPTQHLRPSIETALHVLLPHRYVFHVHSVPAIAAGLTPGGRASFEAVIEGYAHCVIPYAMPGISLARAVHAAVEANQTFETLVLLLENHGLVVGADSIDEAVVVISLIESSLRLVAAPVATVSPGDSTTAGSSLCPPGTLGPVDATNLAGWGLTPDSTVFLGPRPFAAARDDASQSSCLISADGSVKALRDLGADEVEIALSLVDVALQLRGTTRPTRLSPADIDALANWDAEIWRKRMKR